jgi:hypothetical protein
MSSLYRRNLSIHSLNTKSIKFSIIIFIIYSFVIYKVCNQYTIESKIFSPL